MQTVTAHTITVIKYKSKGSLHDVMGPYILCDMVIDLS